MAATIEEILQDNQKTVTTTLKASVVEALRLMLEYDFSQLPIVDEGGSMGQEFRTWTQTINDRTLIIGIGTPEGFVEAPIGAAYMDSTGLTGSVQYVKQKADIAGDKSKGWIL